MFKRKLIQRILAIALVFTLTFSNFALVTKTYAASIFEAVFSTKGSTGSKDVEFEAYFRNENEATDSVKANVNDENLKLNFDLRLLNKGYVKNGTITISEAQENQGINFKIIEGFENDKIESFEDYKMNLVKIEGESEHTIEVPIEYFYEEFITLDKLSKDFKVKFNGTYVNSEAEEVELEKEIILNLSWTENREFTVDSELTKFFEYESDGKKYSTLQTLIKIDTNTDKKTLPIQEIETIIEIPEFDGAEVTNIAIVPQATGATNNKTNEEVVFNTENIAIDEENNTLTIKTKNEIQTVVETFENEILKEVEEEISEKYFSGKGVDEYLVTYTIENLNIENNQEIKQKILTNVKSYSEENVAETIGETTGMPQQETEKSYTIFGQTGEIISYQTLNETESLSKGNIYLNYNSENKTELELKTKSIINISNHEFVEEINLSIEDIYYLQKDGNKLDANDIYYKNISISRENFEKILGTEGKIEIFDLDGNLLKTIDLSVEPTEEYLVIDLETNLNKITLKTSAPITEGNLNINITKIKNGSGYDKNTYSNIASINENIIVKSKYKDAIELADIANETITTKLEDTFTNVNLVINKDSLSTLVENTDVEIKIELNNHKIESDIFGNSTFEIKLPEYVRQVEITNSSMVYGDGLEINNVEAFEKEGRIFLRITVSGKQIGLSSGIVTNGTNIVLNTNIKIDEYAPAKQEEIVLYYYNDEVTNYLGETTQNTLGQIGGIVNKTIEYSAPVGVVTVNNISNYNDLNSNLVSINQGMKKDKIEIYSSSKNAKMEMIVMNNNQNAISNVSILGRIPFKGVKDIVTGEDLGTTIDSKLISTINSKNNANFNVYYSSNGDATKDLNDSSNGWTLNIDSLDNIKSFLIVPADENYIMDASTILRFEYEFLIPENLEHNTDIVSTFATYYTNNTEIGDSSEVSVPDIVYLTTGVGPQFNIQTSTNAQGAITEFEEFKIISKLTNTGKDTAYDIRIGVPVPQNTTFVKSNFDENIKAYNEENTIKFNIEKLEIGQSIEVSIDVKVNKFEMTEQQNNKIEVFSNVEAKDLSKTIISNKEIVELKQAEMKVELTSDKNHFERILTEENEIELRLKVFNLTKQTLNNAIATMKLDDSYEFIRAYTETVTNGEFIENTIECFDSESKMIKWNIGNLEGYDISVLKIKIKLKALEDGITKKKISNVVVVKADGTEEYSSPEKTIVIGGANIEVKQTTSTTDTYVKEGNKINYTFTVKNTGIVNAEGVKLVDKIPTGLTVTNMNYTVNGINTNKTVSRQDEASVYTTIAPGDTLTVNLTAVASNIEQADELSVTNMATVSGKNIETMTSNSITHIIEAAEQAPEFESSNAIASSGNNTNTNITKTYKISGVAWLDTNENGIREDDEERLSAISAMLVESNTGVIKSKLTTNSKGAYTFTNVENGNYLIIFDYDTVRYAVTGYQKEGAANNVNSDVINTTIMQDGKQRTGAVTDIITIENGSFSNVDIGLVLADSFDLRLEKKINKITVQNSSGTDTIEFNNADIAKSEIAAKYLDGSTVYIEYTIRVSNVGELAGYAKKIVDYIPEDTIFNSGLKGNENWYSGLDGNLYSSSLANEKLEPGQSKEIKLILTKQMTEDNAGLISNTAEIYEDYNVYGVKDRNSTVANKIQNENDMNIADVLIGIKTGEVFIYISVIITSIILGGIVIFLAYNKLIYRRKVGV